MLFSDEILSSKYSHLYREIKEKIPEVQLFSQGKQALWESVIQDSDFKAIQYAPFMITYQEYYLEDKCEEIIPLYFIFFSGKQPIGIWPLSIFKTAGKYECSFLTDSILAPPVVKNTSHKIIRKIFMDCWNILEILRKHFQIQNLKFMHNYYGPEIVLSEFQRFLCEKGAQTHIIHGSVVDLHWPCEKIMSNLRKSYKPLISHGRRLFEYRMYDGDNMEREVFNQVSQLHLRMAGRVTRNQSSWNEQYNWIINKHALLNCLYKDGVLVGASLFPYTEDMAVYLIGVYDRNLFDQPISHILLMEAIRYFQNSNTRILYLGLRHYENDYWLKPDKKLLSISYFKEGFATHVSLHIHQNIDSA